MHTLFTRIPICALCLGCAAGIAGPSSPASVVQLTSAATAVVTGTIDAALGNPIVNATIVVDGVLKGGITTGTTLHLTWTPPPNPYPAGKIAAYKGHGIFFLAAGAGGSWSLLPAISGSVDLRGTYIPTPASVPQQIRAPAERSLSSGTATDLDRVVMEVLVATEAQGQSPGVDLAWLFREAQSPTVAAGLARFRSSPNANLRVIGLTGLAVANDAAVVPALHKDYSSLSPRPEWRRLVEQIKYYYLNSSAGSVQSLGEMTMDANVPLDLRIAGAAALARIHTRPSLPYLARLLDEQQPTLVAAAVGGLASFANNVPIGSHEPAAGEWPYRTDETINHSSFDEASIANRGSYYVGFWKTWWLANQAKLSQ